VRTEAVTTVEAIARDEAAVRAEAIAHAEVQAVSHAATQTSPYLKEAESTEESNRQDGAARYYELQSVRRWLGRWFQVYN
jgi:hypothetical protein